VDEALAAASTRTASPTLNRKQSKSVEVPGGTNRERFSGYNWRDGLLSDTRLVQNSDGCRVGRVGGHATISLCFVLVGGVLADRVVDQG